MLAPLLAVMLFLAAIAASFTYLRFEELERRERSGRARCRVRPTAPAPAHAGTPRRVHATLARFGQPRNQRRRVQAARHQPHQSQPRGAKPGMAGRQTAGGGVFRGGALQPAPRARGGGLHPPGQRQPAAEFGLGNRSAVLQPAAAKRPQPHAAHDGAVHRRQTLQGPDLGRIRLDGLYHYGIPSELSSRYAISFIDEKTKAWQG